MAQLESRMAVPQAKEKGNHRSVGFGIIPNKPRGVAQHDGVPCFHPMQAFVQQARTITHRKPEAKLKNIQIRE